MEDLIHLDSCRPKSGKWSVQERLSGVSTPLNLPGWESMLENHPDKQYVYFILNGIRDGFRLGFQRESDKDLVISSARKNMKSADENP